MKILFDSHALVWFLLGDQRCPLSLRTMAAEADIVISAVVVWEIASKVNRGKWPEATAIAATLNELLAEHAYVALPITLQHAHVAGFLQSRHRDPFDRMLAAQAQVEGIPLATADPAFRELGVSIVW
jgi:PIN domain nuclease of toxin-antitoxin system